MRIAGFDQSLTSFGAARISPASPVELHRWKPPGKLRGGERLQWHLNNVEEFVQDCDLAIVEGLAFGAKGSSLLDLAGLFTLVTHRLWQLGVPYAVVTPNLRAKYITGNGSASKEDCFVAVVKRFPGIEVNGHDQADALTLAAMGADQFGFPLAQLPVVQRAVLTAIVPAKKLVPAHPAIAWPELRKAA